MFRCVLSIVFVIGCCLTAVLAQTAKPAAARTVVVKNDGRTVAGEITEATPAGVTVRTSPKLDPVTLAWHDIKRMSNGLTRAKVVDDYRRNHKELLCDTCNGDGTTNCEVCGGTGIDPAQATSCDKCHGTGNLGDCPKCKDGKIPCPNPACIKPSMFVNAPKEPDGHRWYTFKGHHKSLRVAEGHVGQVIKFVDGEPEWDDGAICPICNGTSVVVCPTCHGTGKKECPTCHGVGKVGPACTKCEKGKVECATCSGSGMKDAGAAATKSH